MNVCVCVCVCMCVYVCAHKCGVRLRLSMYIYCAMLVRDQKFSRRLSYWVGTRLRWLFAKFRLKPRVGVEWHRLLQLLRNGSCWLLRSEPCVCGGETRAP